MHYINKVIKGSIIFLMIMLFCSGCGQSSSPVLNVILHKDNPDTTTFEYYTIYDNGTAKKADKLTADDAAEFYTADNTAFHSDIINNQIENTLQNTLLTDQAGNIIEADDISVALMQAVADTIKHDIIQLRIVKIDNQIFAFVQLNVNWSDPCKLYQYNTETDTLNLLHQWEGVDLVGVATP